MRVLLVEDHLQLAESVAQALKATGLTVDVLHDGVAADLALASEEYAAAILDVGLPRLDGFEVLARLRALPHLATTPIIVTSAGLIPAEAGPDPHTAALPKPFEIAGLDALLRAVTEQRMLQAGV